MNRGFVLRLAVFSFVALTGAACTIADQKAPPLAGPSELGLSLTVLANPDVISQDGASQALVAIQTFDENGQPKKGVPLRAEIVFNNTFTDWGSLSARNLVTDNNGRATLVYTAPPAPLVSVASNSQSSVQIRLTPTGTDAANLLARTVNIRLVPPGVILGGGGPTAAFTVSPAAPSAFIPATFDASTSTVPGGLGTIVSYAWNFGDGTGVTTSSRTTIHQYNTDGTFVVQLTVMDNNGITGTTSQPVTVGRGNVPTAAFSFSPTPVITNRPTTFSGALSTPGAGRRLVRYDWDFGTGGATQSGITVTKSFDTVGTYNVRLTVTDDVGQQDIQENAVSVSANAASAVTARYTWSPSPVQTNQPATFDASASSTTNGTIIRYEWNFNDGSNPITSTTNTTIQHTFTQQAGPGGYPVRLTVFDSNGASNSVTQNVVVQ